VILVRLTLRETCWYEMNFMGLHQILVSKVPVSRIIVIVFKMVAKVTFASQTVEENFSKD